MRVNGEKEEEKKNTFRILARMPEGKRSLGSTRYKWEDNIKLKWNLEIYGVI
jgi:hypothetical protein